jgi:Protein of unknown function (DUF3617)
MLRVRYQETTMNTAAATIAAAAALLLAGCSGGNADADGNGEVSIKEAAEQAKDELPKPQPGLYKTTVTMTALDIPGMPPEMKDHGAGLVRTLEDCLTAEEVDKGFEAMVKQGQNGECSYESFALADGKIDAVLVCKAEGRAIRTSMSGTTTSTGADLTATTAMEFDGAGKGTMTATVKHERVGECPAK